MKNILLPIDFSDVLIRQLHAAARLSEPGGTITIVHVPDTHGEGIQLSTRLGIENIDEHLLAELVWCRMVLQSTVPELNVQTHVENGPVAKILARVAGEFECDGVIIGSHGHGKIHQALYGSTTERAMRLLNLPVCVVPSSAARRSKDRTSGNPVLVAVDLTDEAIDLIRLGIRSALRMPGPEVYVVHAFPAGSTRSPVADLATLQELIVDACKAEGFDSQRIHALVAPGEVRKVAMEKVRRLRPGLLVMGRHHHGLLHRLVLGSNAEEIMKSSRCPCLIHPFQPVASVSLPVAMQP